MNVNINIKRALPNAILPRYAYETDNCFDLFATRSVDVLPQQTVFMDIGWIFELPRGCGMEIHPRSGWACKKKLIIPNSPGNIDPDYRKSVEVCLLNISEGVIHIEEGAKIAQAKLIPILYAVFNVVDDVSITKRGEKGFGSSGY
jgi:dUTP pyrophosphatase